MENEGISQWSASAADIPFATVSSFITGSMPGNPMQMGHTFVFGSAPKESFLHEQNIFDFVEIWACISNPITGSKLELDKPIKMIKIKPAFNNLIISHG